MRLAVDQRLRVIGAPVAGGGGAAEFTNPAGLNSRESAADPLFSVGRLP